MTPFVWRDRLAKIEDGMLMLSAKGRHDDFEFYPDKVDLKTQAVAMTVGGNRVYDADVAEGDCLRLISDRAYILTDDDFSVARLELELRRRAKPEFDAPVSVEVKP